MKGANGAGQFASFAAVRAGGVGLASPTIGDVMPVQRVPKPGGGKRERDRNNDGGWRNKRSDTGKKRGK
jgi:hypothetical protein